MEQNDSFRASNSTVEDSDLKIGPGDSGWEIGILEDPTRPNDVKCTLCGKVTKAGTNRHKVRIVGIKGKGVRPCPKASKELKNKCLEALEENNSKKLDKGLHDARLRDEVVASLSTREEEEDEISIIEGGSRKRRNHVGPMDNFSRPIKVDDASTSKRTKQQNIYDAIAKKRLLEVHHYLARWVYEAGISFNAIDNDSFKKIIEALGQYGPGYTPPFQYQLREPLLKGEMERTKESLKKQEEWWKNNGCSIMTDAWSDRKRRSIMNLCVNCKLGTTFLSSKETNDDAHTGQYIFDYVNECTKEVGEEKVVQIITNNASNNMAAAKLLKLHRPNIFWTSCPTHTLNLMLGGISRLPSFKGVINKAKSFTIFMYAHHKNLALMRKFTKSEIVRPEVTRFATSFLTLESLLDKKQDLGSMMTSIEWDDTKWSKSKKRKEAFVIVVPNHFWNLIEMCLRVFTPLVKVLRLVDGEEKPSMGFVYGQLLRRRMRLERQ